jgi:hypothetical protein
VGTREPPAATFNQPTENKTMTNTYSADFNLTATRNEGWAQYNFDMRSEAAANAYVGESDECFGECPECDKLDTACDACNADAARWEADRDAEDAADAAELATMSPWAIREFEQRHGPIATNTRRLLAEIVRKAL